MGGRITERIERSYLYSGRLCRVCLDIFYEPPEQSYAPPHKAEDCYGKSEEWCTGSYQEWRPYSYGRIIQVNNYVTQKGVKRSGTTKEK